jgi:hypothetical protein
MPKFIVKTDDGSGTQRLDDGANFQAEEAATDDAQIALADMARDALPNGKHAHFEASVVDETGAQVYRASLEFNAQGREEIAANEAETERALDALVRAMRDTDK